MTAAAAGSPVCFGVGPCIAAGLALTLAAGGLPPALARSLASAVLLPAGPLGGGALLPVGALALLPLRVLRLILPVLPLGAALLPLLMLALLAALLLTGAVLGLPGL